MFVVLFLVITSFPACARARDVYPVSCDDLWAAVKDTLQSPRDYAIVSMSDSAWSATFTVIGNLTVRTDRVSLKTADSGCAMKAEITEIGADDPDWRQFHNRISKALVKLQARKNPKVPNTGAQP